MLNDSRIQNNGHRFTETQLRQEGLNDMGSCVVTHTAVMQTQTQLHT